MTPSCIQIEELAGAVFGAHYLDKVFAMIAAYFDDSGTSESDPAFVLGGCIATVDNWIKLQHEWEAILGKYNLPYFHATDFECREGIFHDTKFKREDRLPLQKALLAEMKLRIQAIVVMAVNQKEYEEFFRFPVRLYPYTAFMCLQGVEAWADEHHYDGPIAYAFDKGGGSKKIGRRGELDILKNDIADDPILSKRFRMKDIASWNYPEVGKSPQLQTADIVAYEAWKDLKNNFFPSPQKRSRISASTLILTEKVYQGYYGREEFLSNDNKWISKIINGG